MCWRCTLIIISVLSCIVIILPRDEGWTHHKRSSSIALCPRQVLLAVPSICWFIAQYCSAKLSLVILVHGIMVLCLGWYLFLRNPFLSAEYVHNMPAFLSFTVTSKFLSTPAAWSTHSLVFLAVHDTLNTYLRYFISKTFILSSSAFLWVQLSQPCSATGQTFGSQILVDMDMPWFCQIFLSVTTML